MARKDITTALESSLVPTVEKDLPLLSITDDNDRTVTFPTNAGSGAAAPVILLVQADGDFLAGDDACVQANDVVFSAGQIYSFPVSGRLAWHFMRAAGGGTVNVKMKLYLGN